METHFEDVRQDEKHVTDLLEAIIWPTDPVKEALRKKLFKMNQFVSKSNKSWFQLFGFRKSKVFQPEANASLVAGRFPAIFGPASGQIFQKMMVLSASERFLP